MSGRIFVWLVIVAMLGAMGVALFSVGVLTRTLPVFIAGVVILALLIFWVPRCFRTVGSPEAKARAVLIRFGRPIGVLEAGLHIVWWPIEQLVIYPTKQYLLTFNLGKVHSKKDDEHATALMEVATKLYFAWAEGPALLTNFERLPTPTRSFEDDTIMLTEFFEPTVSDGVRAIMARHNHRENREQKDIIEGEIKTHLFAQEGNPFKEGELPGDKVDVIITEIRFTEEMEEAFSAPEVGRKRGEEAAEEMSRALRATGQTYRELGFLGRLFAPFLARARR